MSYENIISKFMDKIIFEIKKPYFKEKVENSIIKPVIELAIKKCYPYVFLLFFLYIILLFLLIFIIIVLIYNKKK